MNGNYLSEKKPKRTNKKNNKTNSPKLQKQQLSEDFCSGGTGEKSQTVIGSLNNVLE